MAKFEVGIFNAEVRRLVEMNKRHRDLTDDWADIHYIEIEADDADSARRSVARKYPAERGFVIETIDAFRY